MNNSIKKLLSIMLALGLVLGMAACGATEEAPADDSQAEGETPAGGELIIGGSGPLTGDAATYGISVQQGAQLAVEEINAAGGINGMNVTFLFEDDEADGEMAKSAYESLMDQGMQIMMGTVTSGAGVAINDLVAEDGILQVTPSASQIECAINPNTFRICFTDPLQGKAMAEYTYNELGYTKAAVIHNQDDSYSVGIYEAFKEAYTALGGEITADTSFPSDATDFSAQMTTISSAEADFLFMPIYAEKAAQIVIEANRKELALPYVGCDGIDGILNYLEGENAALVEGLIFLTPFVSTDPNPAIVKFTADYTEKYGVAPDQFAADGYDAIYAIKAAVETAGSVDNAALVTAMTEISLDGLTGKLEFDASGEPQKDAKVAKIVDGVYVAQ